MGGSVLSSSSSANIIERAERRVCMRVEEACGSGECMLC